MRKLSGGLFSEEKEGKDFLVILALELKYKELLAGNAYIFKIAFFKSSGGFYLSDPL